MTKAGKLIVLLVASLGVVAGFGSAVATGGARADKRPNVIVIMTDDESVENLRFTPNVRALIAARGVTFDNSFVNLSLCCPSRATFLTGQYAHNHRVTTNGEPGGGYYALDHTNTLAVWLQKSGYFTILIGKYLNHYGDRNPNEVPPGWNEWHSPLNPYRYYDFSMNENGTVKKYTTTYETDLFTQEAVNLIHDHGSSGRPFFMWLTYVAPHAASSHSSEEKSRGFSTPPVPAKRDEGKLSSLPLPTPPSFNEADVSDKPSYVRKLPPLSKEATAKIAADYRARAESLLAVDGGVKKIFDALAAAHALENTYVVFTSDNGWIEGEHRIASGKNVPYEPSIRVPLLVRGPGVPANVHLAQPVINADLAPTIVDVTGAVPRRTMDGASLRPLLEDRTLWWGRDLLLEGSGRDVTKLWFHGLRTPRYAYVEYESPPETELYDIAKDPYELQNVASSPAYAKVRAELAARLARLRTCEGASCRVQAALQVSVQCSGALTSIALSGADAERVVAVDFSVGGRRAVIDRQAPFRVVTKLRGSARALATLDDGRRMTLERSQPRC